MNASTVTSSKATILVVEDSEPFRRFVCSILQQRPEFELFEACDGEEALQSARKVQPHLILFDIGLPKLNGIAAARCVESAVPRAKILFLTQGSSSEIIREALSVDAAGYIHKLQVLDDLLPAVEASLQGERFVSCEMQTERQHRYHGLPHPRCSNTERT